MNVTPQRIEAALAQMCPHLTAGLSPMDAVYVLGTYQRVILPNRLKEAAGEPSALSEARLEAELERALAEVAPLPATERLAAVRLESYRARMAVLSDEAFRVARTAAAERGGGQVQPQATVLRQQLERLLAEVAATEGVTAADLGPELSETMLDIAYAERPGVVVSFRLQHILEASA